jgi:hypothetical protein
MTSHEKACQDFFIATTTNGTQGMSLNNRILGRIIAQKIMIHD